MRTPDEQARIEVLARYADQTATMLVARDAYRQKGRRMEAAVCQEMIELLSAAYKLERDDPPVYIRETKGDTQ